VVQSFLKILTYKVPYQPSQYYDTINITITQAVVPVTSCVETPVFIQRNTTTPGCKYINVTTGIHTLCRQYFNISESKKKVTTVSIISTNTTAACQRQCDNCTNTCTADTCYDERYPVWTSKLFETPAINTSYVIGPLIATAAVKLSMKALLPPPEAPVLQSKTQTSVTLSFGYPDVYVTLHTLPVTYTIQAIDSNGNIMTMTHFTTVL
jgi:hypothetical protein